jgi:anti-sigma regulatory factor (Ser/Thr protein kinase)
MRPSRDPTSGDVTRPVQVELAQDDGTPGRARRVTRDALLDWHLPGLVDVVVLVVSELVTNAVRYGRPPLSMELRRRPREVRLAVHDGNPTEPVAPGGTAAAHAESGRGMGIVGVLADDVVVEQVTDDGKIIHAAFCIPSSDPPAEAVPCTPTRPLREIADP